MNNVHVVGGAGEGHEQIADAVVHDLGRFDEDDSVELEALGSHGG